MSFIFIHSPQDRLWMITPVSTKRVVKTITTPDSHNTFEMKLVTLTNCNQRSAITNTKKTFYPLELIPAIIQQIDTHSAKMLQWFFRWCGQIRCRSNVINEINRSRVEPEPEPEPENCRISTNKIKIFTRMKEKLLRSLGKI